MSITCFSGFRLVDNPQDGVLCCHLLALVFQTGVVIVSWHGHRDLAAASGGCFLIPPLPLLCSVPFLAASFQALHGVDMALWMLATVISSLRNAFVLVSHACRLVDYVSWFFFSTDTIDIFVFIGCKSWLKWLYLMVVVLLWAYGTPEI